MNDMPMNIRRVLVVGDDPVFVESLYRYLCEAFPDLEVETEQDSIIAVKKWETRKPAIVILSDPALPTRNGFDVAEQIREVTGSQEFPHIIMVTENVRRRPKADAHQAGINDCVPKPIRLDLLREKIERALRRIEAIRKQNKKKERA